MKKIIIFTNLPQRDKLIDDILAGALKARGFEVRVEQFLPRNREHILYYKPDIAVIPEARCEYTIALAKQCMSWGITVVIRRGEGGACQGAWDKMQDTERETVIGAWPYDVDLEIVWCDKFKELMVEYGYLPEEKIFVAGGVPFDVYFKEVKPPRPKDRKVILFAPGWGHADRSPEYNIPEAPPGSPLHKAASDRHRVGRAHWLEMIKRVHEEFPDWKKYLRVKTGEYIKPYQDVVSDEVGVLQPCPAIVALYNIDLLIHAGSTLAIEAHLSNTPALSYYGSINQVAGYDYPHVSPDFENLDGLVEAIKNAELDKSNANEESIKILEREFYGAIDGKAIDRMADKIASLELKPTCTPSEWPADENTYYTPGTSKNINQWMCECCHKVSFTFEQKEMIKCPWCGIALARRTSPEQVMNMGREIKS